MITTAHAARSRPTLKDDERFRHGLVRDLQEKLFITVLLCPLTAPLEIRSTSKRLSRRLVLFYFQCVPVYDVYVRINQYASMNEFTQHWKTAHTFLVILLISTQTHLYIVK